MIIRMYGSIQGLWSNRRARWTAARRSPETDTAADSDSAAHSGSCCGGLGPASQPLLVPPQRLGGCADTPTSTPSERPCAQVPADMNCARRVSPLGTPGPLQVCSPQGCRWMLCDSFCQLPAVVHPPKDAGGEILTHSPTVEVVRIKVKDVTTRPPWVVPLDHGIVSSGVAL